MLFVRREGFPVGFWEQIYLGLVGIFVNKKWSQSVMPEDYEYMFDSLPMAYSFLMDLYDNYDKITPAYFRKYWEYVDKNLDKMLVYDKLRDVFVQHRMPLSLSDVTIKEVGEVLTTIGDKFTWVEFIDRLAERYHSLKIKLRNSVHYIIASPSYYQLHRYLLEIGYECKILTEERIYERK